MKAIHVTLFLGVLFSLACTDKEAISSQAEPSPKVGASETLDPMQQFMLESLNKTPFMGLIEHTDVRILDVEDPDPSDDYAEQRHIYQAAVLNVFRGPKVKVIEYAMVVEKGEAHQAFTGPVVMSLCKNNEEWIFPGVGASFPGTEENIALLKKHAKTLAKDQSQFTLCD